MKFRIWLNRRRLARTVHSTPIYATVAEDMDLNPHGGAIGLFNQTPLWPTEDQR